MRFLLGGVVVLGIGVVVLLAMRYLAFGKPETFVVDDLRGLLHEEVGS